MRSTERFVQMTGLLLALIGSLALCGVSYVTFKSGAVERAVRPRGFIAQTDLADGRGWRLAAGGRWSRSIAMNRIVLLAALACAAWVTTAGAARAEIEYPWCIMTGGRDGGVMSCGYVSFAQCMQTRVGTDMCIVNPRYQGRRR